MGWLAISFEAGHADAESLSDALAEQGAVAIWIEDAAAGTDAEHVLFGEPGAEEQLWPRCKVSALFPDIVHGDVAMRAATASAGVKFPSNLRIESVADADWVRRTQAQFEPIHASSRLWIVQSWRAPVDPAAINIVLDPGAAFGTGSHPTTRLCMRWLDEHIRGGETLLDYGCGSGILAIAGLKLGAGGACGIDIDPRALETASANASANGVVADFELPERLVKGRLFDVTLANILADTLCLLAPLLVTHTCPGGFVVLSGILAQQAEAVLNCYRDWTDMRIYAEEDNWVCLAGARRSD